MLSKTGTNLSKRLNQQKKKVEPTKFLNRKKKKKKGSSRMRTHFRLLMQLLYYKRSEIQFTSKVKEVRFA